MKIIKYPHQESQRIDNFLFAQFRKIPKQLIYRLIRNNIKLNGKRVKPQAKLQFEDLILIPDFLINEPKIIEDEKGMDQLIEKVRRNVIYEDESLLIINKPPNIPVHLGSSNSFGIIEALNHEHPEYELAHRLDKKTTGCLVIAKNRKIAKKMHEIFREKQIKKHYLAVCHGHIDKSINKINLPLYKEPKADLRKKVVVNDERGKESITYIRKVSWLHLTAKNPKQKSKTDSLPMSLVEVEIKSGRTHQIRVHLAHIHHPVLGDDRYGITHLSSETSPSSSLMLHCHRLVFNHPETQEKLELTAKPQYELNKIIDLANQKP